MIVRYIVTVAALLCSSFAVSCDADDPLIHIMCQQEGEAVRFVWQIRQSHLASLPRCEPLTAEVPISPHRAVSAAAEFLAARFPGAKSHGYIVSLNPRGLTPNPIAEELWMYEVHFIYDPELPHRPLHTVLVLMDGKVLVPAEHSGGSCIE
jgi:hypothetical protein